LIYVQYYDYFFMLQIKMIKNVQIFYKKSD